MINPPTAEISGYVVYLAVIFLPGLGLGELLDVWPKDKSVADVLAYAFGLGLAVDTLVLFIRTSGLTVAGYALRGIDLGTVYLIIGLGLAFLLVSAGWRRKLSFIVRPRKVDLALLIPVLAIVIVEALYFAKYPYFPRNESQDFQNHVQYVIWLIDGSKTTIPDGILYYGVHYQLASSVLLVGGEALVTVQRTMALLVALSPLLFYAASRSIFSRRLPALVVTLIFALSGTIWFVSAFITGLFANFFGILAVLFFVMLYSDFSADIKKKRYWVPLLLSLVMLYVSHFTALTIFPALLLIPVVQYVKERKDALRYLIPSALLVVPGVIVLAAIPSTLSLLLRLAANSSAGGLVGISTPLSRSLAAVPILSLMAADIYDDVAFVFLLAFTAVYLWKGLWRKRSMAWIPFLWFASIVAATAFTSDVWRYSYEALVPLTFMGGYGLFALIPGPSRSPRGLKRRSGRGSERNLLTLGILALLLIPMVATSWTEISATDSISGTSDSAASQSAVYSAIYWLKANTPNNSTYLSATDWRFTYANLIISRHMYSLPAGECFYDTNSTLTTAAQQKVNYVIVTNYEPCAFPPGLSSTLWDSFQPPSNTTLAYQDSDVKVFKLG